MAHSTRLCAFCVSPFSPQKPRQRYCSAACGYAARRCDPAAYLDAHTTRSSEDGECWRFTGRIADSGYGIFSVGNKNVRAHRVAYELANGPIPDELIVRHLCPGGGNPWCVNPAHLALGTHLDNVQDREDAGRTAKGERSGRQLHPDSYPEGDTHWTRLHPERLARGDRHSSRTRPESVARGDQHGRAVVTERDVRDIRRLRGEGATCAALAALYGVRESTISAITRRETWRHVV